MQSPAGSWTHRQDFSCPFLVVVSLDLLVCSCLLDLFACVLVRLFRGIVSFFTGCLSFQLPFFVLVFFCFFFFPSLLFSFFRSLFSFCYFFFFFFFHSFFPSFSLSLFLFDHLPSLICLTVYVFVRYFFFFVVKLCLYVNTHC